MHPLCRLCRSLLDAFGLLAWPLFLTSHLVAFLLLVWLGTREAIAMAMFVT